MQQLTLFPSLWQRICTFDNLLLAYQKARRGKKQRKDVANFTLNLEAELLQILLELKSGQYYPGRYRAFHIYEKKARVISVAPFRDRVVHHAIMNVLEPLFEHTLVDTCFACRKGKGVHKAVDYYQTQSRKYAYVLKMDVKKYFPSIDHKQLKSKVTSLVKDEQLCILMDRIIDNCNTVQIGKGLPIGNLTSQIFANLYLSEIDHWISKLPNIAYMRYVDDLFLLGNNKAALWDIKYVLDSKLKALRLQLHKNKSHIYLTREKVDVLGYKITKGKRWLRNENGYRMRRKLRNKAKHYSQGKLSLHEVKQSIMSWIGHSKHGETFGLRDRIFGELIFSK